MRAETAMTRRIVFLTGNETLADAWEIMTEWEIRHLPVMAGDKLAGILSDRDILIHARRGDDNTLVFPQMSATEAMTPNPMTCSPQSSICSICDLMLDHKIDSLPIVEDERLVGLVTSFDLIQLLKMRETPQVRQRLPFKFEIHRSIRPMPQGVAAFSPNY